jgi:hypothetical protein
VWDSVFPVDTILCAGVPKIREGLFSRIVRYEQLWDTGIVDKRHQCFACKTFAGERIESIISVTIGKNLRSLVSSC